MSTGRDSFVPRTAQDPVAVLDVRHQSLSEADGATDEVTSRLVVIDSTEGLPGNDKFYESLLGNPLISRVLCLAVGVNTTAGLSSSVVQPRALFHSRRVGVLWIGDLTGVRWSPRTNEARAVGGGPVDSNISNIDDLVMALRHEEVFDQVFAACDRMPDNTASPGIQLVTAGVASDAVAGVQFDALSRVASDSRSEVSDEFRTDKFKTTVLELGYERGAETPVLVPRSELDGARADAEAALDEAQLAVEQLAGLGALYGQPRPGQHVFAHVNRAARCVELFGSRAHMLLVRMDGNLQTGEPSLSAVTALGVDEPARVQRDDMTSRLRECVQSALRALRSIAVLRRACGHAAALVAPQGCAEALKEVEALLRRPLGAPPRFPSWPVPVWAAPFILLGCLLGALTPGSSPVGEVLVVLLALAWWALGWLLLARRPTDDVDTGEAGFASSAMAAALVYGLPALVGAVMGVLVAHYVEPRSGLVSDGVRWAALAVSLLMLAMACALSWPRAVRRWSRQLELEQWRATSDRLVDVLLDAIRSRWRLSSLQQALSDSLIQVADGLSEIQSVLDPQRCELAAGTDQRANGHRTDSVAAGPVDRSDVTAVVVDDLVDLAVQALRPCWPAIKGGTQLSPGRVGRAAEELVEDYRRHLLNPGLLALPPFASHDDSRARLAVNTWRRYRDGLDALSVNPTDYMTQLCGKDDLGTVRRSGVPAGVVRFAPVVLKEVLSEEGRPLQPVVSHDVLWTPGGGVAGSLRLSALMPGTVVADESVPEETVPAEELE